MKKLLTAAALLATFTVGAANAAESQFDFSYSFASGDLLTGSLIGNLDATGTYIQNISNVQVVFDGVPFSNDVAINALDVTAWNTATTGWDDTATPVVSLNPLLNNFVFADTDVAQNLGATNFFEFVNDPNVGGQVVFAINSNFQDANGNALYQALDTTSSGTWTVTAVPLPTSLPMMAAGLGLLAAAARRRLQA